MKTKTKRGFKAVGFESGADFKSQPREDERTIMQTASRIAFKMHEVHIRSCDISDSVMGNEERQIFSDPLPVCLSNYLDEIEKLVNLVQLEQKRLDKQL